MAALATLRCGAGLTTVASADRCLETIAGFHPGLMTIPLTEDHLGRIDVTSKLRLLQLIERSTAAVIGPGMKQSLGLSKLCRSLFHEAQRPMIFDADALNAIAKDASWEKYSASFVRILTPHPGEFFRLTGVASSNRAGQIQRAKEICAAENMIIVLKGHQTATISQNSVVINSTGNPKMAVGGSGDLLAGVILAFICQHMPPVDATVLAVHLHGLAGDLAASRLATPSVLPTDLLDELPRAFATFARND